MSGAITITSSGASDGSRSNAARSTLSTTSSSRRGPWQRWTRIESSARATGRAALAGASSSRSRSRACRRCSRLASSSADRGRDEEVAVAAVGRRAVFERLLEVGAESPEAGEQRSDRTRRLRTPASRSSRQRSEYQARDGVSTESRTSTIVASPRTTSRWSGGSVDTAKISTASGKRRRRLASSPRRSIGRRRSPRGRPAPDPPCGRDRASPEARGRAGSATRRPDRPAAPRAPVRSRSQSQDPVRSIGDVLVEDVRDLARERRRAASRHPRPSRWRTSGAYTGSCRPPRVDQLRDRPGHPVEIPDARERPRPPRSAAPRRHSRETAAETETRRSRRRRGSRAICCAIQRSMPAPCTTTTERASGSRPGRRQPFGEPREQRLGPIAAFDVEQARRARLEGRLLIGFVVPEGAQARDLPCPRSPRRR